MFKIYDPKNVLLPILRKVPSLYNNKNGYLKEIKSSYKDKALFEKLLAVKLLTFIKSTFKV